MSTSLASAKKRRAPAAQQTPTPTPSQNGVPSRGVPGEQISSAGLTLPQVIALVDKRLIALETGFKDVLENSVHAREPEANPAVPSNLTEVLDEFNLRFDTLAEEMANIKNIVLSLQTYTMDVNKMLLEERVRILSGDTANASL